MSKANISMLNKFWVTIFRRIYQRRLKTIMRGYSKLKKNKKLGFVRRIKQDLVDTHFNDISSSALRLIFHNSRNQAEMVTRQFLLQRNSSIAFNKAILGSIGKKNQMVTYPLPRLWQDILLRHQIKVNRSISTLYWIGYVFLYWGYGVLTILRLTFFSFLRSLRHQTISKTKYSYFVALGKNNLPQPDQDGLSYDICSWYCNWEGRDQEVKVLCHGVKNSTPKTVNGIRVQYLLPPFNLLNRLPQVIEYLIWGLKAITTSAADALHGHWWHALLLAESAKAKCVNLTDSDSLAKEYFFHYSGTIYRPMWTYEAEDKGAKIICYFYSTSEQIKLPEGYESQKYEWGAANWPNYFVWDNFQANAIRRDIDSNATIEVVGPIWFSTTSSEMPELPKLSIAVFDIEPHRKSAHFGFSTLSDYVAAFPNVQFQFLDNIHSTLTELNATMVFKRKREIGDKTVKKYKNIVNKLQQSKCAIVVDPNISAIKVINKTKGVISMPFTSTALYLRDQGIPSVYYDPTGWIPKDDRGAHGIPILSSKKELRAWILEILYSADSR